MDGIASKEGISITNIVHGTLQYRYTIIAEKHSPDERFELCLFDYKTLSESSLHIDSIYYSDTILTNISANDLRKIMLMWLDYYILLEQKKIKEAK